MKRLSLIVFLVCLMTSSVFADTYYWQQTDETSPTYSATDNWTEPNQWSTSSGAPPGTGFSGMPPPPTPTGGEIKMMTNTWMSGTAHCTVNSAVGSYTNVNTSVNGDLYINNSSAVIGFNRTGSGNGLRVGSNTAGGVAPYTGDVNQSAGTVTATNIYLGYGGGNGDGSATGNYIISGGSLSCATSLTVGGGRNSTAGVQTGKFTVDGDSPTISVTALRVGGYDVTTVTTVGTLEFELGSGVSAIGCTSVSLDAGGLNSETDLLVSVIGTPSGDILLVKNTGASAVVGSFDKLNGGSALEGASITLGSVPYTLTYMYDSVSKIKGTVRDGTYNDIALVPEPATIALLSLGLLLVRRNRK